MKKISTLIASIFVFIFLFATLQGIFYTIEDPSYLLESLTYTKDIKPIFKDRCSRCHDYMDGKNWQQYKDAFAYRQTIKQKMITKEMPQGADMPQSERDLIVSWVNEGAKE